MGREGPLLLSTRRRDVKAIDTLRGPLNSLPPMTKQRFSLLIAMLLALHGRAGAADKIPLIKAKVSEPVLEEMMGGCSLKCAFPWRVEAQPGPTRKFVTVRTLNDETAMTAWTADEPASGVGTRIRLSFPKKLPAEMEGATPLYGLDLINGYWKSEELWAQYARLKKARLYYNDKPFNDVVFSDSRHWQRISLPDFMIHSRDFLTLEVLEIFPGQKSGLALTEIVLQGGH
jgi:hypothetical protein